MGHDLILSPPPSVPCNGELFLVSIAEKIGLSPLTVAGAVDSRLLEVPEGERERDRKIFEEIMATK